MDGNQNPVVAEEAGEQVEPMDATPSPQPQPTPVSEEDQEAVSMVTEDGAPKEGGTQDNDDDDDVVLVGEEPTATAPQDTPSTDCLETAGAVAGVDTSTAAVPSTNPSSPASSSAPKSQATAEPIVIDDEEDPDKDASVASPAHPGGSSASHSPGALSSTEPDSEIRIASVTTLDYTQKESFSTSALDTLPHEDDEQADMNLMITSVTSLQGGTAADTAVSLDTKMILPFHPIYCCT